jgi:8-amino-7-oxononanoate synthase
MDVNFTEWLERRLRKLRDQQLLRQLRSIEEVRGARIKHGGVVYDNFGSNDYLGLAQDARLKEAVVDYIKDENQLLGGSAARLMTGNSRILQDAEDRLAKFKGCEAGLLFSSGFSMAVGVIPALVQRGDFLLLDRKAHACLIDGARLSEGTVRVFPHNDMEALEALLIRIRERHPTAKIWIITESLFSMDGDWAPIKRLVELKKQFGAWLLVDEAHATGIYGEKHRGLLELQKAESEVEVQVGTLGKALGLSGGYVVGTRVLIDYLMNRARSFIFSTAPWPALGAALIRSLEIVENDETSMVLQNRLWANAYYLKRKLYGENVMPPAAPIFPILVGDEGRAVEVMEYLRAMGLWVPAIRYPTVAKGQARLRVSVTGAHDEEAMDRLAEGLIELGLVSSL